MIRQLASKNFNNKNYSLGSLKKCKLFVTDNEKTIISFLKACTAVSYIAFGCQPNSQKFFQFHTHTHTDPHFLFFLFLFYFMESSVGCKLYKELIMSINKALRKKMTSLFLLYISFCII